MSSFDDLFTHFSGSSESNFVDSRMLYQSSTDRRSVSRQDINNSLWDSSLQDKFSQSQSSERGLFGRFQHSGATGSEERAEFPSSHGQGEVPGNDLGADSDWFLSSVSEGGVSHIWEYFTVDFVSPASIVSDGLHHKSQISSLCN